MYRTWNGNIGDFIRGMQFPDAQDDHGPNESFAILPRPFAWNEEQIAMLFDSIMRGFPIGTLLIWRTDAAVKHRDFIIHWPDSAASGADVLLATGAKDVVLDGHQRLQSLMIGLAGSYHRRELYFDVTSGDSTSPDGIRYRFGFKDASVSWPWVRVKDLLGEMSRDTLDWSGPYENVFSATVSGASLEAEREKIADNLTLVLLQFRAGRYSLPFRFVSSSEFNQSGADSRMYTANEAAEIFKRANACGTAPDRFLASLV